VDGALTAAIFGAAAAGSIGFIGNGIYTSRCGFDQPWLRRLRNMGIAVVWPLVILKAFV
jgi:hypothetical protein